MLVTEPSHNSVATGRISPTIATIATIATGPTRTARTALITAGATRTTITARPARAAGIVIRPAAGSTVTAGSTTARFPAFPAATTAPARRVHGLQLGHLGRRQDGFQLGLGLGFQGIDLFELVRCQVEPLTGPGGQQMEAALAAFVEVAAGAALATRTAIHRRRLRGIRRGGAVGILGGEQGGRGPERQYGEE